jgi:sigma-B regulation protein RsbU (phosphoserine phosphatase)
MRQGNQQRAHRRRRTLIGKLLVLVNGVLIVAFALFSAWDYRLSWRTLLEQKRIALEEEAKVLLPSAVRLRKQGADAVQAYIDEACGAMQETTSPGHHIVVRMSGEVLQAQAHHRASPAILDGMLEAIRTGKGLAPVEGNPIVVGSAMRGPVEVYVSEYLFNIEKAIRWQAFQRLAGILIAGIALGLVLNFALHRFLAAPLDSMVGVVHRFGDGQLDARMPETTTLELGLLADEFDRMAGALQQVEAERRVHMKKAARIQDNLRPDLGRLPGVEAACLFRPAEEIAGDYYDVMRCHDGSIIYCVADASGHGVPAAMAAGMLKAILEIGVEREGRPSELMGIVNTAFCRLGLAEDFATMILVRWAAGGGDVSYANAGQEPGYLLHAGTIAEVLEPTGPVLGVEEKAQWNGRDLRVDSGDRMVLLTDGLPETASSTGEMFGRQRVQALLRAKSA